MVLLTRPLADSEALAQAVAAYGFSAFIEPMIHIETIRVEFSNPDDFQGLVITSAHALSSVPMNWIETGKPVYAVGDRTAEIARSLGFQTVHSAGGTAEDLETLLRELGLKGKLLHPCGLDGEALSVPGLGIVRLPVYEARAAEQFSNELLNLLDRRALAAALFYSPRTGRIFADLAEKYRRTDCLKATKALCFSAPVVKSIRHLPWAGVRQAGRPDSPAMLALLRDLKSGINSIEE